MSAGVLIAIGIVAVFLVAFVWITYNRMVARSQASENSWSQIDVALRRRHDLIPALVEAVKGYATQSCSSGGGGGFAGGGGGFAGGGGGGSW